MQSKLIIPAVLLSFVTSLSYASNPKDEQSNSQLDNIKSVAAEIVKQQYSQEEKELAKLPDVLHCDKMQWMSSCYAINKQAKKNPAAPLRVNSKNGVEINFPPGTPSTVIRMVLEGSPQAAKEFIKEYDAKLGMYNRAASASQNEMWRIGGIKNAKDVHESVEDRKKQVDINADNLELFIFVESSCTACGRQLKNIKNLSAKYPQLNIRVYQLDSNQELFKEKVTDLGLSGKVLTKTEAQKIKSKGVVSWPTMWIDNNKLNKRSIYRGIFNMKHMEDILLAVDKREVK